MTVNLSETIQHYDRESKAYRLAAKGTEGKSKEIDIANAIYSEGKRDAFIAVRDFMKQHVEILIGDDKSC